MDAEVERTRREAEEMAMRSKEEDEQRKGAIMEERKRKETEERAREEIMKRGMEERERKNRERKEEIRLQEQLLTGRGTRAKTTDLAVERRGSKEGGQGIQVLHYRDPGE